MPSTSEGAEAGVDILQQALLTAVVALGLVALGSARLGNGIRAVGAQGALVAGLVAVVHQDELTPHVVALAAGGALLKGVAIPAVLFRSVRQVGALEETAPFVGFATSVVLGVVGLGLGFGLAALLPPQPVSGDPLLVPVSLATVLMGMVLLVTRRIAAGQVLGYLVLDNGIFVFGLSLAAELPILVEMGLLLDLFAAVFIMGITIFHINREFDHIDASLLRALHDVRRPGSFGARRRPDTREGH